MGPALRKSGGDARDAFIWDDNCQSKDPSGRKRNRGMLNESTRIPEVLLLIPAQYLPLIIDKISNIMQLVFPRLCLHMCFH